MRRFLLGCWLVGIVLSPAFAASFDDFNAGISASNRGENSAAIEAFDRAIASRDLAENLKPVAYTDRGLAYVRQKRFDRAIEDFDTALKLNPTNYDAIYWRMIAYAQNGQEKSAATECDKLIKARARVQNVYTLCGTIRWMAGDFAGSASYFGTAIGISSRPSPYDALWLEIVRERANIPDQAQLAAVAKYFDFDSWPAPLVKLYLGKSTPEETLIAAEHSAAPPFAFPFFDLDKRPSPDDPAQRRYYCEAEFFVGEWQLLHQNFSAAKMLLRETETDCDDWLAAQAEVDRVTTQ